MSLTCLHGSAACNFLLSGSFSSLCVCLCCFVVFCPSYPFVVLQLPDVHLQTMHVTTNYLSQLMVCACVRASGLGTTKIISSFVFVLLLLFPGRQYDRFAVQCCPADILNFPDHG